MLGLLAIGLLIFATGVFVAAEFALVASDRGRVEAMAEAGSRRARAARGVLKHAAFHLSGVQFGITVASLLLGFVAEPSLAHLIEPVLEPVLHGATPFVGVVVALTIATLAEMVLGELVPKTLAIAGPERAALLLAPFLRVYGAVFGPVIRVLNRAANGVVRKLGIEPREELQAVRSLSELAVLIETSAEEGTIADSASRLLARSIRFTEKSAADVLVPRVEVVGIGEGDSAADLVALSIATGHSRFPVYGADLDDVRGVVWVKSVHRLAPEDRGGTTVGELMDEARAVPESLLLQPLLADMQQSRSHLVVVVDEYGGTAGIVTLEDLVEEIVGEIADEFDPLTPEYTPALPGRSQVIPAALHPDEVEDATGFEMPDGDFETLAGFLLDELGHVPEQGEVVDYGPWRFEVVTVDKRRIVDVRVTRELDA